MGKRDESDKPCFSESKPTNMDVDSDDIILDLSSDDYFVREVGGHASASTPTPSAPSVPQPVTNTTMLEELDTHPPEFLFLQESELQPQAPILPEILPQPQLSQSELIAMRSA